MRRFASDTKVDESVSRMEIEKLVKRNGASRFASSWEPAGSVIAFEIGGRQIKFVLPMPDPKAREFTHTPERGALRSDASRQATYDQAVRTRWRALLLIIKAKFEAIAAGVTTVEDEFLSATVNPDTGRTVGEEIQGQITTAYRVGGSGPLLIGRPR